MDPDIQRRAEQAFAEYLSLSRGDGEPGFEAFCARYPDLAEALRGFRKQHQSILDMMAAQGNEAWPSIPARADPGISLQDSAPPSAEALARLRQHAPRTSRYELHDEVARGGMGVIFKVWDPDLRRALAMKTLLIDRKGRSADQDGTRDHLLARFLEEAQITGQLEHPGIVPVHDLGLDAEGRAFFTMPLVRGRDFKEVIRRVHEGRDGWSLTKALRVIMKVCEAVAYAHSRGVIHRDLKPANVMVGRFGETYVMDWGLARVMNRTESRDLGPREQPSSIDPQTEFEDARPGSSRSSSLTHAGAVIGTPAYMSPEQASGRVEALDGRADVYSIGAMLYHLLSGEMPYCPAGRVVAPGDVIAARRKGPPRPVHEIRPGIAPDLASICEKAMATDPGGRYATPLELAEDIERYMTDRPVSALEASRSHHLWLAYRRNRGLANTVAAAATVLMIVLFAWLASRSRVRQRRFDVISARALPVRAAELFPAFPAAIPGLDEWLSQADELLGREGWWQRERARATAENLPEVESVLKSMQHLRELRPGVQDRLALAHRLEDPEQYDRERSWRAAVEAVATLPVYGGLQLQPIEGLIPLGPDPTSGLWEFWNVPSGRRPASRDPVTGSIRPTAEDGIVLVLVPGDTGGGAASAPFLIGKFEVTQAQWLRIMGTNPSLYAAGATLVKKVSGLHPDYVVTDLHPVESVSWTQCQEFARRVGLALVAEDRWEHACGAGVTTRWIWGDQVESLEGKVNLADWSAETFRAPGMPWDDGYATHAPVGSYPPNAFGLHDMDGNVAEWCESWYAADWLGTNVRRKIRGASFVDLFDRAEITWDGTFERPDSNNYRSGLRVGLSLP